MFVYVSAKLKQGFEYTTDHKQLFVVMAAILVLPLLLWYSNQQYLRSGEQNLERMMKDKVGLMHDTLLSLLIASGYNGEIMQSEIERIALLNPDILDFVIARQLGNEVIPLASLNREAIGRPEENPQFYRNALVRLDESIIFPAVEGGTRYWYTYRAFETESADLYYIYTKFSLAAIDTTLANNAVRANWSFVYVYLFFILLAIWHIKLTDYKFLYEESKTIIIAKDQFMNVLAHELRTPLTAIRGYASLLTGSLSGDTKDQADRIEDSAEHMLMLINDLLEVSRLQSGKITVSTESVALKSLIDTVCHELRSVAEAKQINLVNELDDASLTVAADPKRLTQVLTNLVGNAIKYTPKGAITISAEPALDMIELRVKDTGMGITAEDQQRLFAPFFRTEQADLSTITGSGLGMWITKSLVELMHGSIAVESIRNVGTHVVVRLPKA